MAVSLIAEDYKGQRFRACAPTRIDLAGGTLDLWPLHLFHPGAMTVNLAIDVQASCELLLEKTSGNTPSISLFSKNLEREVLYPTPEEFFLARDDQGLELLGLPLRFFLKRSLEDGLQGISVRMETESVSFVGAGLGGSSALLIAICSVLNHVLKTGLSEERILEVAKNLETCLMKTPAGTQDYYPPLYGGLSIIHYGVEGENRQSVPGFPLRRLRNHLTLVYSGEPHHSGLKNWDVLKAYVDGKAGLQDHFDGVRDATLLMKEAVEKEDLAGIRDAMERDWQHRQKLSSGILTPRLEELIAKARQAGAEAAKVCGAGGGGCVVFWSPDGRALEKSLRAAGETVIDFEVSEEGVRIERL